MEKTVRSILTAIRSRRDQALHNFTKKFDGHSPRSLEVTASERRHAHTLVPREELASLKLAAQRIRRFHEKQAQGIQKSWRFQDHGVLLGEQIRPLARAGIYVPGGLAAYPSTVLMNAIPAKVAGVSKIIMATPWVGGKSNPYTLVAADLAGVDRIFKIGGAQAIAALAYGTKTVPAVDKIVGPGNIYVATAKRLVFGQVGIDMVAGPTEVLVVADDSARADFIASDLLSQAEHDPRATAILVTSSQKLATQVQSELKRQLVLLPRQEILSQALKNQGLILISRNLEEAIDLANQIASEHLELQIKNPRKWLSKIKNAGAIFLGHQSPVAVGDYLAGPNHVLPTAGSARFSSPLSAHDFYKRSSVIEMNGKSMKRFGPHISRLARLEGLTAHAASVDIRLQSR